MKRYLLDTNTVSHLMRGHQAVAAMVLAVPMAALCISVITEGELLFGVAKRPANQGLHHAVQEFLKRVDVLPWGRAAAACYGTVCAEMSRHGKVLSPLDLLIASHALSVGAIMVTNDQAFAQVALLQREDWTTEVG